MRLQLFRRAALGCMFAATLAAPLAAQFPADSAIRAILQERVQSRRNAGIVVGLLEADGSRRIIAYGPQTPGGPPIDGNTVFEIGSITKVFTSTLLADMHLRGELSIEDPVQKYLPAGVTVPKRDGKEIRLVDLATHSSALPPIPANMRPADTSNPYADYTVQQMYDFLSSYQLTRAIGSQYQYSNLAVGLLGHVLGLRAGKSFDQLLRERIFGPLKMNSSTITLSPELKRRLAPGHNPAGDVVPNWDLPTLAGAGAIRSTANDMLLFLAANVAEPTTPLTKAMKLAHERRKLGEANGVTGLNWHYAPAPAGKTMIWHNGGTGGYRTFAGFDPESRRAVVVLSNTSTSVDDLGGHILFPAMPLSSPPAPPVPRREITVPAATLEAYVGEYQLAPGFIIAVTREGDRLSAQATGQGKLGLSAETETDFFFRDLDAQIRFVKENGNVVALILFQNGQQGRAPRVNKE